MDTNPISVVTTPPLFHHKFRNPMLLNPIGPPAVEALTACNESQLLNLKFRTPQTDCFTPSERHALAELKGVNDIIIKPADICCAEPTRLYRKDLDSCLTDNSTPK